MSSKEPVKTQAKTPAAPVAARIPQPPVAVPEHEAERPAIATQLESAARLGHSLGAVGVDGPAPPTIQRQELPEEEEELMMKPEEGRVGPQGGQAPPQVEAAVHRARGGGQPLDGAVQVQMGETMGFDFSGVRVHADAEADHLNQQLQAKAFTTGPDIFFKRGAYEPGSSNGRELIAHELSHVVQQSSGRVGGAGGGMHVRPAEDTFEEEAGVWARSPALLRCGQGRQAAAGASRRWSASVASEPQSSPGRDGGPHPGRRAKHPLGVFTPATQPKGSGRDRGGIAFIVQRAFTDWWWEDGKRVVSGIAKRRGLRQRGTWLSPAGSSPDRVFKAVRDTARGGTYHSAAGAGDLVDGKTWSCRTLAWLFKYLWCWVTDQDPDDAKDPEVHEEEKQRMSEPGVKPLELKKLGPNVTWKGAEHYSRYSFANHAYATLNNQPYDPLMGKKQTYEQSFPYEVVGDGEVRDVTIDGKEFKIRESKEPTNDFSLWKWQLERPGPAVG